MSNVTTVLIADASGSAASFWLQTTKTIADLIAALPTDSLSGIYLLGTSLHWEPDNWRAGISAPSMADRSFLAPVMAALRARQEHATNFVIVGTGEIFDLADWVSIENATQWALIRVGDQSLQGNGGRLPEITPADLSTLASQLHAAPVGSSPSRQPSPSGFLRHQWVLDRAGFPLVKVEPLDAYVHLFPLTKPQFEQFLCEAPAPARGDAWYEDLLRINPRLSPSASSLDDYERLFITGLIPDELLAYLQWHGQGYQLLSIEQWQVAYRWLSTQDVSVLPAELERELSPVARCLWDGLRMHLCPRTLLDLALLHDNLIEWVVGPGGNWFGMGHPRDRFFPSIHDVLTPYEPPSVIRRSKVWGCRFMRRA
jgi:hypothetical protein